MAEWIVTLDVTVEALSREEAFSRVEALLKDAKTYCLYDAEIADQDAEETDTDNECIGTLGKSTASN